MSVFDYLNAITYKKINIMDGDPYAEKEYKPYLVNHFLAQGEDCIFDANEMNFRHFADKKLQFDYLINTIRKKFRKAGKWLKPELIENLECVKEYYSYNNKKAKDALTLLSESDIDMIKYRLRKGGENHDRNHDRG